MPRGPPPPPPRKLFSVSAAAPEADALATRAAILTYFEPLVAVTVVRTGLQSIRRTEKYTNYRRFLTTGRMVKEPK